jgi:hypothetical protein
MRKWILGVIGTVMLVVLALPGTAAAQMWNLRAYGGWSNSEFYGGSTLLGNEARNGFSAGLAAEYIRDADDVLGFEFGLAYVDKGAKGRIEYNPVDPESQLPEDFNFDGTAKLGYIELNLLFVAHVDTGKKTDVKVYLGPSLGNLISASAEGTADGEDVDEDIKDSLNTFDFGVTAGASFVYELEKFSLVLDARAIMGGTSISKDELSSDLKTRTFLVLAGIEIPLAK